MAGRTTLADGVGGIGFWNEMMMIPLLSAATTIIVTIIIITYYHDHLEMRQSLSIQKSREIPAPSSTVCPSSS
jgi:hypothetical protein